MLKKIGNNELFSSILYIVVGVLLAIFQSETLKWVMIAVGVLFIVTGVLELVKKNWAGGAISLVIGIALVALCWAVLWLALIILGVLIAVKGVIALIDVIKRGMKNALELVFPILAIIVGIGIAFGPLANIIILIAGILLAINGIIGLVGALKSKKD
ncbi:MAG: DUF308 domain-containing protein [Clostridia bacterium]|nr:DUF308 domain-containing protein [Clostridia bacterium]